MSQSHARELVILSRQPFQDRHVLRWTFPRLSLQRTHDRIHIPFTIPPKEQPDTNSHSALHQASPYNNNDHTNRTMALPTKDAFLAQLACDECPICYEDVTGPTTTACNHSFCLECLRHWLRSANTCPCCRAKLYEERTRSSPSNDNGATVAAPAPPYSGSNERRWRNIRLAISDLLVVVTDRQINDTALLIRDIQRRLDLPVHSSLPIIRALQTERAFILVDRFALQLYTSIQRRMVADPNVLSDRMQQLDVDASRLMARLYADMDQISRAIELQDKA